MHAVGRRAERARERAQMAFISSHFLPKAIASHQNAGLGLSPTSWLLGPGKPHPLSWIVSSCVKWETFLLCRDAVLCFTTSFETPLSMLPHNTPSTKGQKGGPTPVNRCSPYSNPPFRSWPRSSPPRVSLRLLAQDPK